jgi:hypothetical protein
MSNLFNPLHFSAQEADSKKITELLVEVILTS